MTFNSNKINFPKSVMIKFRDKFKIRYLMKREPLLCMTIIRGTPSKHHISPLWSSANSLQAWLLSNEGINPYH